MSLNIAPPLPHNIVNAAAPSTESLARANAIKEIVPAPTQVEAYVGQKSREQEARSPVSENPTYDDIKSAQDGSVIPDDPMAEQDSEGTEQQPNNSGEQPEEGGERSESNQENDENEDRRERIEERIEKAEKQAVRQEIQQLEMRDDEVRAHEQAHAAVGGQYAGTPKYQYETGPNGQKYAVSGEVPIDVSRESTPQETIQKMQTVRAAALAPAEPSSQDRKVAAEASQKILEARAELIRENMVTRNGGDAEEKQTVNTESPLAQEPRKRDLKGATETKTAELTSDEQEQGLVANEGVEISSLHVEGENKDNTSSRVDFENPVIKQKYDQSYQAAKDGFSAVA